MKKLIIVLIILLFATPAYAPIRGGTPALFITEDDNDPEGRVRRLIIPVDGLSQDTSNPSQFQLFYVTPASADSTFVPYTGANDNVDLGANDLTTTGIVTTGDIDYSGRILNTDVTQDAQVTLFAARNDVANNPLIRNYSKTGAGAYTQTSFGHNVSLDLAFRSNGDVYWGGNLDSWTWTANQEMVMKVDFNPNTAMYWRIKDNKSSAMRWGIFAGSDFMTLVTTNNDESVDFGVNIDAGSNSILAGTLSIDTDTLVVNPSGYEDRVGIGTASGIDSLLEVDGPIGLAIETVTGNTTLDNTHSTVLVDASSAAVVITLPTVASSYNNTDGIGRIYNIKKIDASVNVLSIDPNGVETIDGDTILVLSIQHQSATIQSNGTSWFVL